MACVYFIVNVFIPEGADRSPYDGYITAVRPIVESYGGEYLVRTERIDALQAGEKPDRVIVVRFPDRDALDRCFASAEYRAIMGGRTGTVRTKAYIAEGLV